MGFGRSLAGTASLPPAGVVCGQGDVSVTGRSLVERNPTECGVSECDLENSTMRRSRPNRGCRTIKKMCKDTVSFG